MEVITSPANNRVVNIFKLAHNKKMRDDMRLYTAEGHRLVREVPADKLDSIYFTQDFFNREVMTDNNLLLLVNAAEQSSTCFIVTDQCMNKMSDTDNPQGILAVVKQNRYTLPDLLGDGTKKPMIFVMDHLQDPGNMGTIIRMAEGAGATGILIGNNSADIYNPKVVRSTMGSIFRVPIMITEDLSSDLRMLKQAGITLYATHLSGKDIYDEDFREPLAFLIGNEGAGLSDGITALADKMIRIPMEGKVESLNAAVSATVVGYETARQRRV